MVFETQVSLDLRGRELKTDFKISLEQLECMTVLLGVDNVPALFGDLIKGPNPAFGHPLPLGDLSHLPDPPEPGPAVPDQQHGRHLQASPKKCSSGSRIDIPTCVHSGQHVSILKIQGKRSGLLGWEHPPQTILQSRGSWGLKSLIGPPPTLPPCLSQVTSEKRRDSSCPSIVVFGLRDRSLFLTSPDLPQISLA